MDGEGFQAGMPIGGCAAGIFGVTITADGTIMPCRRMDLPIGNIKEVSFRELWAGSPVLWSLRRREDYHGGCESCRYWAICRGCRAIALAYARANGQEDYLGPDPQCPYRCS
jgi:radical SAM protein with 4Fe4S-binding SPASM domain